LNLEIILVLYEPNLGCAAGHLRDLFQTADGILPGCSTKKQCNTQIHISHTYQIHISHKMTTKNKQKMSESVNFFAAYVGC
jgi:hypothetical protein